MPLPIGHAAIGFATQSLCCGELPSFGRCKTLLGVLVLSNLPDIDVVFGILFRGNGNAFHRGPTHSLMFAFIAGFLTYRVWGLWPRLPGFDFKSCFLLILSHILADSVFTSSPISLFWPITVNWSGGYSGLTHVFNLVLFGNQQDAKIIAGCALLILLHRKLTRPGMFKSNSKLRNIFGLGADPIEGNLQ